MTIQQEHGQKGEDLATEHLQANGYTILERNWRFRHEEVDLIVEKGDELIFVEVKTRRTNAFGEPEVWVNRKKQNHLIQAAQGYVDQHNADKEVRFDIVTVLLNKTGPQVHHIEEAFTPRW